MSFADLLLYRTEPTRRYHRVYDFLNNYEINNCINHIQDQPIFKKSLINKVTIKLKEKITDIPIVGEKLNLDLSTWHDVNIDDNALSETLWNKITTNDPDTKDWLKKMFPMFEAIKFHSTWEVFWGDYERKNCQYLMDDDQIKVVCLLCLIDCIITARLNRKNPLEKYEIMIKAGSLLLLEQSVTFDVDYFESGWIMVFHILFTKRHNTYDVRAFRTLRKLQNSTAKKLKDISKLIN